MCGYDHHLITARNRDREGRERPIPMSIRIRRTRKRGDHAAAAQDACKQIPSGSRHPAFLGAWPHELPVQSSRERISRTPDHGPAIRPVIHVRLHVADHPDTLLVPQVAVGSSQLGKYVYVAENGKAVQRMVTTSAPNGDLVIVTHGVKAGEQVIVGNLQKSRPDARVQPTSWR